MNKFINLPNVLIDGKNELKTTAEEIAVYYAIARFTNYNRNEAVLNIGMMKSVLGFKARDNDLTQKILIAMVGLIEKGLIGEIRIMDDGLPVKLDNVEDDGKFSCEFLRKVKAENTEECYKSVAVRATTTLIIEVSSLETFFPVYDKHIEAIRLMDGRRRFQMVAYMIYISRRINFTQNGGVGFLSQRMASRCGNRATIKSYNEMFHNAKLINYSYEYNEDEVSSTNFSFYDSELNS